MSRASDNLSKLRSRTKKFSKQYVRGVNSATGKYAKIVKASLGKASDLTSYIKTKRNQREASLDTMRGQYIEATRTVLNSEALKQLAIHSNITAPTLTSIMSGYEHARASQAERIGSLVKASERRVVRDNANDQRDVTAQRQDLRDERTLAGVVYEADKGANRDVFNSEGKLVGTEFDQQEKDRITDEANVTYEKRTRSNRSYQDKVRKEGYTRDDKEYKRDNTEYDRRTKSNRTYQDTVRKEGYTRDDKEYRRDNTEYDRRTKSNRTYQDTVRDDNQSFQLKRDKNRPSSSSRRRDGVSAVLRSMSRTGRSAPSASRIESPTRTTSETPSDFTVHPAPRSEEIRDFRGVVLGAESGGAGYNAFNRGKAGDSKGISLDLTRMTVGEVKRRQSLPEGDPNRLFAVGAYQAIPATLSGATDALGISDDELFNEEVQDRIFSGNLIKKQAGLYSYLIGENDDIDGAAKAAATEWAGLPDPSTGRSVYDKDKGNNSSSAKIEDVRSSLQAARENIATLLEQGASEEEAVRIAMLGGTFESAPQEPDKIVASEEGHSPEYRQQVQRFEQQVLQQASNAGLENWKASGAVEGQQQTFIDEATIALTQKAQQGFESDYEAFRAQDDQFTDEALSAKYVADKKTAGDNPSNAELTSYLEQEKAKRQAELDALERARKDLWGIK